MSNLLRETINKLNSHNISEKDVVWVGTHEEYMTWEEFKAISNFDYDSGFGAQVISKDLTVVGSNWWLERYEYDGSECWEFKKLPIKPKVHNSKINLKENDNV